MTPKPAHRLGVPMLLLHNPRCSKSREAKALLEANGVAFDVRLYLDQPLSLDELRILKARLGRPPAEWIRFQEPEAKEAGITKGDPPMRLLEAVAAHPRLLERPILMTENKAVVGRPPEDVLQLVGPAGRP